MGWAIFYGNNSRSLFTRLLIIFIFTSGIIFATLLAVFVSLSENFASFAVEAGLHGMAEDLKDGFYIDQNRNIRIDDSEVVLIWGTDALYSNLGYRLVDVVQGEMVFRSVAANTVGAIIDAVPLKISDGYSKIDDSIDVFRTETKLGETSYYLDVFRSDLIGQLANEAIIPALVDLSLSAMLLSAVVFLTVAVVAVRLIVNSVEVLASQVSTIQPDDLAARISSEKMPKEFKPIVLAFNKALARVDAAFSQQNQFVSNAAHELRTPLSIQMNRIELSMDDSDLRNELLRDSLYMSRIVEQLLDLSRVQSIVNPQKTSIELVSLTKDIVSRLVPLATDRNHVIEFETEVSAVYVDSDRGELEMVIKNLFENAIKHTPQWSKIIIRVGEFFFSVEDSGEGIAEENKIKIFDRFWREDQSTLTGSGLGLAIVSEIASRSSLEVTVSRSMLLGGAKFLVEFQDRKPSQNTVHNSNGA